MSSAGPELRDRPEWDEAVEVAHATMTRAQTNVDRLVELLPSAGYSFQRPAIETVRRASPSDLQELDRFEREVGPVPLALRAWKEIVGDVDLNGGNAEWAFEYLDPLVVEFPMDYVWSEHAEWLIDRGTEWDRGQFTIDIAPDYLHKANVSGGGPYAMVVPDLGVDGPVLEEPHNTSFVDYLRIAFRWAGLPGFDPSSAHYDWAMPPAFPVELRRIAANLLPL